jgi:hypothetical protein
MCDLQPWSSNWKVPHEQVAGSHFDKVTNEEIKARDEYMELLRSEDPSREVALNKIGERL